MPERIDELVAPPIVGRMYFVPTVRYPMHGIVRDWPVMGPRHTDIEHLNFPALHYHFDHRFIAPRDFDSLFVDGWFHVSVTVHARVLSEYTRNHLPGFETLPVEPVWRRRKCQRSSIAYPHDSIERAPRRDGFKALWGAFEGRQARRGSSGWLCPHRQYPLGAASSADGMITCPLHGLRICATTGVVMQRLREMNEEAKT